MPSGFLGIHGRAAPGVRAEAPEAEISRTARSTREEAARGDGSGHSGRAPENHCLRSRLRSLAKDGEFVVVVAVVCVALASMVDFVVEIWLVRWSLVALVEWFGNGTVWVWMLRI